MMCGLNGPASCPFIWGCPRWSLGFPLILSACFVFFFPPLYRPSLLPPPLARSLPLQTKFDALGSGPSREFSVRVTALLNMASDGMILTNHDHQIRVGVLTGKNTTNKQTNKNADVLVNCFSPAVSPDLFHVGCLLACLGLCAFCSLLKATVI